MITGFFRFWLQKAHHLLYNKQVISTDFFKKGVSK